MHAMDQASLSKGHYSSQTTIVLIQNLSSSVEIHSNDGEVTDICRSRITIRTDKFAASFFASDVHAECPVWIPEYHVIITGGTDKRTFPEIENTIKAKGLRFQTKQYQLEKEESFDSACLATRDMRAPVWLGVGLDIGFSQHGCPSPGKGRQKHLLRLRDRPRGWWADPGQVYLEVRRNTGKNIYQDSAPEPPATGLSGWCA